MEWISLILDYRNIKNDVDPINKINLDQHKNVISTYKKRDWNRLVRMHYDYELVPILCIPKQVNRAYFKLREMIKYFELLSKKHIDKEYVSVHLAEGPGGFIDAIRDACKTKDIRHNWVGITLNTSNKKDNVNFHENLDKFNITYGKDNTGNILNLDNLIYLEDVVLKKFNRKANLTTADGGFDVSNDYNKQEDNSIELIAYEIIGALLVTAIGGDFIMKVFDTFNLQTIHVLYILTLCFKKMSIYKPKMSRPCNSEKYIICEGFVGTQYIKPFGLNDERFNLFIGFISKSNTDISQLQINALTDIFNGTRRTFIQQNESAMSLLSSIMN